MFTFNDLRKSDGKATFTSGGRKYEYDYVTRSLWLFQEDGNRVLNESLTPAEHQLLLNGLGGEVVESITLFPDIEKHSYVDTDIGLGTVPAPKYTPDITSEGATLGRLPSIQVGNVRGVGKIPTIQRVNFDLNRQPPRSTDPFEEMPVDGSSLKEFITNAIKESNVTKKPRFQRTMRRRWR